MNAPTTKPTTEELNALPENVRAYILALESEVDSLQRRLQGNEDELRRKRFAYWKR